MSVVTISQDGLGISHGDFFRIIPRLYPEANLKLNPTGAVIEWTNNKTVKISLGREGIRNLGLLKFPITDVCFSFHNCPQQFLHTFMMVFNRGFQKGGG